jgi:pilus assembly protein Flp/PilA
MSTLRRFIQDESGATAIEYALIAALITIVAMAAFQEFGRVMSSKFEMISTSVTAAS